MKISHPFHHLLTILLFVFFNISCEQEETAVDMVSLNENEIFFNSEGGIFTLLIETSASEWNIDNPMDWVELSKSNGNSGSAAVIVQVHSKTTDFRKDTLTIVAGTALNYVIVQQTESEYIYSLSVNQSEITFEKEESSYSLTITTDAPQWTLSSSQDWISFDPPNGSGDATAIISASDNSAGTVREATIILEATYAPIQTISILQNGDLYPNYNTDPLPPDASGMSSTAEELAAKMTLGWNIGNTMEATGGETAWGNPQISLNYINALKNMGFNAIRIPCSFDQYANPATAEIQSDWLSRVEEVVQYCTDNDMYVFLNIHWDGGWLENNTTEDKQEAVNAKQKAFWQQIATHFRDFDEHLIFAGSNEPNVEDATQMAVLMSYHQTFVNAVRSTGGKNSHRVLVIQGASTDIEKTKSLFNAFPTDEIADKLMMELHYYTPYQFTLMEEDASWGKMFYYWGNDYHSTIDPTRNATWGEETELDRLFSIMDEQFISNGYPIILGEFGAYKRSNIPDQALHEASVEYFNKYVVEASKRHGIVPFYWDTGGSINRNTGEVLDQGVIDALFEGATN